MDDKNPPSPKSGNETPPDEAAANQKSKGISSLSETDRALIAGRSTTDEPGPTGPPITVTGNPPITVTANPPGPTGPPITVTANPPGPTGPPITVTANPPPPPNAHDPYSDDFDCNVATPAEKQVRNNLDALRRLANGIMTIGAGTVGGQTGYDNREYLGFAWRDATGQEHASTLAVGDRSQNGAYALVSSMPGGLIDTLVIGGESIPINQIIGSVHNHPSNNVDANSQPLQPLPSQAVYNAAGQIIGGDYPSDKQLIDLGASPDLLIGIFGEAVKGEGYQLRTYPYQNPPPYDLNDRSTWATAYGPMVTNALNPCP